MAQVKVWNDNKHDLVTYFKGNDLKIPAGKFIEMEFYDAHEFKGQYHPIKADSSGLQDPKTMKIIRIEPVEKKEETAHESPTYVCMQCTHKSPSSEELEAHIKVRHADTVRLEIPEEDERLKRAKLKKTS